jgi:hypothetical protein
MESEMKTVFQQKVAEKETKLKQSEVLVFESRMSFMRATGR